MIRKPGNRPELWMLVLALEFSPRDLRAHGPEMAEQYLVETYPEFWLWL